MSILVKIGDIIRIEKGMNISTLAPVSIFNKEKPFSQEYANFVVEVGKVYKSSPYSRETIIKKINHFLRSEFNVFLFRWKFD